jgi:hypothetical protein
MYNILANKCIYLVCNNFKLCNFLCQLTVQGGSAGGVMHMIRWEAALPMSWYIVPDVNTRCVLYPQPVGYAGLEVCSQVPHMALYV